jgi:Mrp family chromosome partitioning ATPase
MNRMDVSTAREMLKQVMDPELNRNIVDLGMVHDLAYEDGVVSFTLALTTMACPLRGRIQQDAREALLALDEVCDVVINVREMTAEEKERVFGGAGEQQGAASAYNNVKHVVAVMSGKGGVGKSSVAALLALVLRRKGYSVGLMDADITGPSIPKMLLEDDSARPLGSPMGILPVVSRDGIKIMSINLLLPDPNLAVIWRGPLISGAIQQFWRDVFWGDLDYLVVDLPPGTSDAALTVMQAIPLNGVVLVTTPQSLAGMVVRKASSMAAQLNVPILGLVENMSYVKCPDCGKIIEVFGPSNAADVAVAMRVPVLGRLPVDPRIATLSDSGRLAEYEAEEFEPVVDRLLKVMPEIATVPPVRG